MPRPQLDLAPRSGPKRPSGSSLQVVGDSPHLRLVGLPAVGSELLTGVALAMQERNGRPSAPPRSAAPRTDRIGREDAEPAGIRGYRRIDADFHREVRHYCAMVHHRRHDVRRHPAKSPEYCECAALRSRKPKLRRKRHKFLRPERMAGSENFVGARSDGFSAYRLAGFLRWSRPEVSWQVFGPLFEFLIADHGRLVGLLARVTCDSGEMDISAYHSFFVQDFSNISAWRRRYCSLRSSALIEFPRRPWLGFGAATTRWLRCSLLHLQPGSCVRSVPSWPTTIDSKGAPEASTRPPSNWTKRPERCSSRGFVRPPTCPLLRYERAPRRSTPPAGHSPE